MTEEFSARELYLSQSARRDFVYYARYLTKGIPSKGRLSIDRFMYHLQGVSDSLVAGILIGLCVGAALASWLFHLQTQSPRFPIWADGFFQNFGTEMFGAWLTFLFIETLVSARRRRREIIRDLGSNDNATTWRAARELEERRWHRDGTLKQADLYNADLHDIWWEGADLEGAILVDANLENISWVGANLEDAFLTGANLTDANLSGSRLTWAHLEVANLHRAFLSTADLEGANLSEANLLGVELEHAKFDPKTILPDGTNWTPDTDMKRFTDSEHPQYWRSDFPDSPASQVGDDDD